MEKLFAFAMGVDHVGGLLELLRTNHRNFVCLSLGCLSFAGILLTAMCIGVKLKS